ncbi:hypothetical protein ACRALDRAFT_1071314 [Sodiomyces alcalophilus JCM 7366]|uniref:uncharacterized protein n=1 Tax=Sodiomyces alcalophilus JCM 7366 TaxID=591952 RepID=UPI0039B5A42D
MDHLQNLPLELLINVCLNVDSPKDLKPLYLASPVAFRHRTIINNAFMRQQLPGQLLNDALTLIHFPRPDGPPPLGYPPLKVRLRHFKQWASRQFPNPFEPQNKAEFLALTRLCERLDYYMADFVSKATSLFPPREYLYVPSPNTPATAPRRVAAALKLSRLNPAESIRLRRAFIEYELICKFGKPLGAAFARRRTTSPCQTEARQCVFDYVSSIYGAVCAHFSAEFHPTRPSDLCYPDSVFFDPYAYADDWGHHRVELPFRLASHGLDLITAVLNLPKKRSQANNECIMSMTESDWEGFLDRLAHASEIQGDRYFTDRAACPWTSDDFSLDDWLRAPGLPRTLVAQIPKKGVFSGHHCGLDCGGDYVRNLRQRAWVFFDDDRLYALPQSTRLPEIRIPASVPIRPTLRNYGYKPL